MRNAQPLEGVLSELPVELEERLIKEVKARGSVAAGAAECGVSKEAARPALLAAAQGGHLIRDEIIELSDGTIERVREWAPPDGKLASLMLDDISMEG